MINGNRRLLDGVLLVVIGVIFLLNSLGVIPWGIWASLWRFWPVLLILAGVSIVTHQRIPFLALIAAALVIVVALAWALPGTIPDLHFGNFSVTRNHTNTSLAIAPDAAGKPLTATLNFGAGDLRVGGTTDLAFDVRVDHTGPAPIISSQSGANGTTLDAKSGLTGGTINIGRISETWTVAFNRDLPLNVIVNAGACDAKLDMSDYNLTSLNLSSGASDVDITIGPRSQAVDVTVSSAASDVKLRLPQAAGVRLKSQSVLNDANFSKAGLSKQGEYWTSSGYDAAAQKINVTISGVVGSIDITR